MESSPICVELGTKLAFFPFLLVKERAHLFCFEVTSVGFVWVNNDRIILYVLKTVTILHLSLLDIKK